MRKINVLALVVAAFAGGVAVVIAGAAVAGHRQMAVVDNTVHRVDMSNFYTVRNRASKATERENDRQVTSLAECEPGDVVVGGGCWIYSAGATNHEDTFRDVHHPVAFGPMPQTPSPGDPDVNDVYACVYDNLANDVGAVVVATAICSHPHEHVHTQAKADVKPAPTPAVH